MILHENESLFMNAIRVTAQQMDIKPVYIEKDYWVTYALYTIFRNNIGNECVFKGGTALSKCFNLIDRFSEDIDLVILRNTGETDNNLKTKLKQVGKIIESALPEIEIPDITRKMGMNRKTAHSYTKMFSGDYGQIRDIIVLEATWLGYYEPYTTKFIQSFVGEMMLKNNQAEIAETHNLMPFEVKALEPTRTICEKIMSLVRFSYSENPIYELKKKIRHSYDLHKLLEKPELLHFFELEAFEKMLLKVATDDVASFRNNNDWLANHPNSALIFSDLENVWNELSTEYTGNFRKLVYGELPKETAVFETLKTIRNRLAVITWTIKTDRK
ncbi:MAG TPA: hypothetical protein DCQ31_18975 [Bacteroidales bacterium]|nr:hypothetical protein [Bacteroidales bacterium]